LRAAWQRSRGGVLIGTVLFGWSLLTPGASEWLNRAVILMSLMLAGVALFGAGLDHSSGRPDWSKHFATVCRDDRGSGSSSSSYELGSIANRVWCRAVSFLALAAALTLAAAVVIYIFFAVSPA
jgi:hypothetical protein